MLLALILKLLVIVRYHSPKGAPAIFLTMVELNHSVPEDKDSLY